MTWTVIYTRSMVKKSRHCHVGDSTDSMGSGPILKNLYFSRVESNFFLQGLKPKVHYITGAKNTINPILNEIQNSFIFFLQK